VKIYNILGKQVLNRVITKPTTTIETDNLPSGIYFYTVNGNNKTIQYGKLITKN
jgi:hypothetical protein